MTLIERYEQAIETQAIMDNSAQRDALKVLNPLFQALPLTKHRFFPWRRVPAKGFYLHGAVGVGKTYLMDLFFQEAETTQKKRFHFHHFMQQIDAQLRHLQGRKNPLQKIGLALASSYTLLCFDELMVEEVTQAMIFAELFPLLVTKGVVLGFTSNQAPQELYLEGLQRERFLLAIEAIEEHCSVIELKGDKDYRQGKGFEVGAYLHPLNEENRQKFTNQFISLAPEYKGNGILKILGREIAYVHCSERMIWFDFKIICNLPRSSLDYLEIASSFDTIFISDIPLLGESDTVFVWLFMVLVDILYDRKVRLILSAAVPLEELYVKGELRLAFKRIESRLQEMQSPAYLMCKVGLEAKPLFVE